MNWPGLLLMPTLIVYLSLMLMLSVYISNYLYLVALSLRARRRAQKTDLSETLPWPRVTVQLPIYNEVHVAARLIQTAAELDYPPGSLEIQVLDDSTDETVAVVAAEVARQLERGMDIVHLRRDQRAGFKAGALAQGASVAKGDFLAIFDADFVPARDFLRKMMPLFDDERVAFAQARWAHLNREYSLLTMMQSLLLDAHFAVDQRARSSAGQFFNFNGTAGIWRKTAIMDAGGWRADTLTEDLDLSYRAFLRGWKARYAVDVEAAGELPVDLSALRRQQLRWARGSMECAIRFLPRIWSRPGPFWGKVQPSLHLTAYATHFLTLGLILILPILLGLSNQYPALLDPRGIGLLPNLMFFVPAVYVITGQHLLGRGWLRRLPLILLMSVLASGLMLNTVSAALQILRGKIIPFERTPKYGIVDRRQDWRNKRYRVKTDRLVFLEAALAGFTLWTAWAAWHTNHWLIMLYSVLFAAGFLFTSGVTLMQWLSQRLASEPAARVARQVGDAVH